MKKHHILSDENIGKLLIRLSLPATFGMFTMALYNVVDSIYVGHGVGPLGLAGISIVFPYHMFILAIGHLLGIGGGSLISRNLGSGNKEVANKTLGNILMLELMLGIFLTATGYLFMDDILRIFGATPTIHPYAKDYMGIILAGNILFLHLVTTNNILRSEGLAKTAMRTMLISAILNIILDPLFIFTLNLGIKGAAIATIISQFIASIYLVHFFYGGKSSLDIGLKYFTIDFSILKEIGSIGISAFGRSISNSILIIVLNNVLGRFGDTYIAVYGIIHRVLSFTMMPAQGIAQGLQPIVGFNFGAKKISNILLGIKDAVIYATLMTSFGFLLMILFPAQIMGIFTTDINTITLGANCLRIIVAVFPIIGIQIVSTTVFQAIGKAKPAFLLSISRQMLFFIPLILSLPYFFKISGVWLAFPLADVFSALLSFFFLYKQIQEFKMDLK